MKNIAFAIGCHPDDIEFFMAGTLLLLKDQGFEIHYMNVANGSCGTHHLSYEEIVSMRAQEGKDAAAFAGAHFHGSLCNDFEVLYERDTLYKLSSIVREVRPSIILTHPTEDYMEDHMITARLVVTAAFSRCSINFPVQPERKENLDEVALYHCQPNNSRDLYGKEVQPEFYIDVSEMIDSKTEMLAFHKSQKKWLDQSQGLGSYLKAMKDGTAELGNMSGKFSFAEGWRQHFHTGFSNEHFHPLQEALKNKVLQNPEYR